jgi:hypothetical protein
MSQVNKGIGNNISDLYKLRERLLKIITAAVL